MFGPRYNSLPKYLTDIETVKTKKFKFEVDKFLEHFPGELKMHNYVTVAKRNSILDQVLWHIVGLKDLQQQWSLGRRAGFTASKTTLSFPSKIVNTCTNSEPSRPKINTINFEEAFWCQDVSGVNYWLQDDLFEYDLWQKYTIILHVFSHWAEVRYNISIVWCMGATAMKHEIESATTTLFTLHCVVMLSH